MRDSTTRLEAFVRQPVRFRCKPPILNPRVASYPEVIRKAMGNIPAPNARFEVTTSHELRGSASANDLKALTSLLGRHATQFEKFYAKHDGFILYQDPLSTAMGVELIELRDWSKASEYMRGMMGQVAPVGR